MNSDRVTGLILTALAAAGVVLLLVQRQHMLRLEDRQYDALSNHVSKVEDDLRETRSEYLTTQAYVNKLARTMAEAGVDVPTPPWEDE